MQRILLGLGMWGMLGCSADATDDPAAVKQRWLDNAPQQYVAKSCGQGFAPPFCTVSAVEAGQPVETQVQDLDGAWAASDAAEDVVDGILNAATRDTDGCERRVEQHPSYAFPESVYFDCGEEGWGVATTCFEANTLDVSRCQ